MERRTDTDWLAAFWRCVKRMRALQCSYFESRDWQLLTAARIAEQSVDRWLEALENRFGEQTKFEWTDEHRNSSKDGRS